MRQHVWKRTTAALLAAAVGILGMPGAAVQGQDTAAVSDFIGVVEDEASEYGLIPVHYVDAQGNEITPELRPEYGLRAASYPASYDLRQETGKGLPAIRDQNPTGTCWAHAVIGSIESQLIKSGRADTDIDLSEAHLVWFSRCSYVTDEKDPLYHDGLNLGTDGYDAGGNALYAIAALASWSGYVDETMTSPVTTRPKVDEKLRYSSAGHLQNTETYSTSDHDAIKNAIMTTGGLYAAYYSDETAYLYRKRVNSSYYYSYYCDDAAQQINHGVLIVGWDDNYDPAYFNPGCQPSQKGAWLCRNSWGKNWGDKGYFWMSYEDATLDTITSFRTESTDNYDGIYQYDRHYAAEYIEDGAAVTTGANIFTAGQEENLAAVSFMTNDASTEYTVQIYTDVEAGKPDSGTLALTDTGMAVYAGYHTVPLTKLIQLTEGQRFSVVLSVNKGGIWLDNNSVSEDVSFIRYSFNGRNRWVPPGNNTGGTRNVCVKAFTYEGIRIDEAHFPDPALREFALSCDRDDNGILSSEERSLVLNADLSSKGITTLEGIEYFDHLTSLNCSRNPLAFADVSALKALEAFTCTGCTVDLGTAACTAAAQPGLDASRISGLTGARLSAGGVLCPDADTITYTYDCGGGFLRSFTIKGSFTHAYKQSQSISDTQHEWTCSDCGHVMDENHSFGAWTDQKNGQHAKVCEICGESIAEAHSFGPYTVNADGTHTHTCTVCGYAETSAHALSSYTGKNDQTHLAVCKDCAYVAELAHNWRYVNNPLQGDHSLVCDDCGYTTRKMNEAHTLGAAADNKDGTHSQTCTLCGGVVTGAHTYGDYTANSDGTHTRVCTVCGSAETVKHSFSAWKDAGDGTHLRTCVCGAVEQSAHTFGDYTVNADGTHTHTCTVCGNSETAAHVLGTYKDNADGTHSRSCKICGDAETGAHTYGTKYTINKDGTHSLTCTKCGHVEAEAHTFGKCSDNGNGTHTHICTVCKYMESQAHDFGGYEVTDGVTTRACRDCGVKDYLYGDADGDLKLTVKDLVLVQKHLLGLRTTIADLRSADMDGNGVLDVFDLAYLKRALLRQ